MGCLTSDDLLCVVDDEERKQQRTSCRIDEMERGESTGSASTQYRSNRKYEAETEEDHHSGEEVRAQTSEIIVCLTCEDGQGEHNESSDANRDQDRLFRVLDADETDHHSFAQREEG